MNTQPASFGELINASWMQFRASTQTILTGAVVFAIIIGILQVPSISDRAHGTVSSLGGLLSLLAMVATLVSYVFYLFIATKKKMETGALFGEALKRTVSFIGLSIWIMIRTFTWIAIVGIFAAGIGGATQNYPLLLVGLVLTIIGMICTIIMGPRFALAPALWAMENTGVYASANRSYDATRGYWAKIFGNVILISIIFAVVIGILGAILSPLALISATLLSVVIGFVSQCYQAFFSIFLVQLTQTILAHPHKA